MSALPQAQQRAIGAPSGPMGVGSGGAGGQPLTRADVLGLGQRGTPWAFVPLGLAALRVEPRDEQMRMLVAAAYCRLGLKTAAGGELSRIQATMPAVAALRSAVERLSNDRMEVAERVGNARGNVRVLAARGLELEDVLRRWEERNRGEEWFRCGDGNIVRRLGTSDWIRFADEAGAARGPIGPRQIGKGKASPIYFEGMDPPWLLLRVCEESARGSDGHWARVVVMVEDPLDLMDGLACADLHKVMGQERVEIVVGPGAGAKLEQRLRDRITSDLGCVALVSGSRKPDPKSWPGEVLRRVLDEQQVAAVRCVSEVNRRYAGRDAAWWGRRYAAALEGRAEPLRVLIPTTRYSTYIQHASGDIAAAFEAAGCRARVLIEPDDSTKLAAWAYAKEVEDFEPDLVLLLNYTRKHIGGMIPAEVPFVCWVQDAMGHLFDAEVGRAQGPLDFLVGHPHEALFRDFGFCGERVLPAPVLASARKFDGERFPPPAALVKRHECEIACVTHQSQPAEAYAAELVKRHPSPAGKRLIQALLPVVRGICEEAGETRCLARFAGAVEGAMSECGLPVSEGGIATMVYQVCHPLADRFLRCQMLEWAAAAARERGWRLHLYGRGWEKHPTLAPFARGELAHGEELRASYRAARVHLHASINPYLHQRVMECALSGGLPLVRFKRDDLALIEAHTHAQCGVKSGCPADGAESMALVAQYQRLGIQYPEGGGYDPDPAHNPCNPWASQRSEVVWLLGDLAETTFASREQLERLVEAAVTRSQWRGSLSAGIAERVRRNLTYEAFAHRIVGMVAGHLGGA